MNPALDSRSLDRRILALALPALGALAADPLVSLVDTLFVGRLGPVPLAALGVNTSVFAMAFVVFNFLAYGTTPLVARSVGAGDLVRATRLVAQAMTLATLIGLLALVGLELMAEPVLALMGTGGDLRAPALTYLRIRALAGPAVLIITAAHGSFRGFQDTRTPFRVTLALNLVNLVLDPLFIFGFGWGLAGAAWATVIAQWVGALWFLRLLVRGPVGVARPKFSSAAVQPRTFIPFLRIGGALAIRTVALIGTLTLATAIATRIGTLAVAAHQVGSQVWLLLALVVDSLAVAAQALVAHFRGERDAARARSAADRLLVWGLGTGLGLAALLWTFGPYLPRLFTDDMAVIAAVEGIMPFIIWMQPLNALVFVWDGVFIGSEDFRFLAVQMSASALVAGGVLLLTAHYGLGLAGVWWGVVALMATRAATLAARYFGPGNRGLARQVVP